jgi:hypothetical protein
VIRISRASVPGQGYGLRTGNDARRSTGDALLYLEIWHIATRVRDTAKVLIDARSDTHPRRRDAMLTIERSRTRPKLASRGSLGSFARLPMRSLAGRR